MTGIYENARYKYSVTYEYQLPDQVTKEYVDEVGNESVTNGIVETGSVKFVGYNTNEIITKFYTAVNAHIKENGLYYNFKYISIVKDELYTEEDIQKSTIKLYKFEAKNIYVLADNIILENGETKLNETDILILIDKDQFPWTLTPTEIVTVESG